LYTPTTTAVYFARAFGLSHNLIEITSPYVSRKGYSPTQDLVALINDGLPKPDLALWIDSGGGFFPTGWEKLECPTAVYLIDVHTHLELRDALAPFFDYLFVAQRDYVDHFRQLGYPNVFWLPLACDPEIHGRSYPAKVWQVGFVGKSGTGDRARRLSLLAKRYKLNDFNQQYPIEKIADVYGKAEIVFNSSIGGDVNMRVFEGLASGALLVTDRVKNGQSELFTDGVHLVEYETDQEMLAYIDYYLANELERQRIAREGRELVLSDHTYQHRCNEMLRIIFNSNPPQLSAKVREYNPKTLRRMYQNYYQMQYMVSAMLDSLYGAFSDRDDVFNSLSQVILVFVRRLSQIFRSS
jgi:spore maturation protein CgeB